MTISSTVISGGTYTYQNLGVIRTGQDTLYVFVATQSTVRCYRSTNNGSSWSRMDSSNEPSYSSALGRALLASDRSTIWVSYLSTGNTISFRLFDTSSNAWGSEQFTYTFPDSYVNFDMWTLDSNDKVHLFYKKYSDYSVYYVNHVSGSWTSEDQVVSSSVVGNYTILGGVDADDDDNLYIAIRGANGFYMAHGTSGDWTTVAVSTPLPTYNTSFSGRLVRKADDSFAYILAFDYHTSADPTYNNYYQSYVWIFKSEDFVNWNVWKSAIINNENSAYHEVGYYRCSADVIGYGKWDGKITITLNKAYGTGVSYRGGCSFMRENYDDNGENMTHHITNLQTGSTRSSTCYNNNPIVVYDKNAQYWRGDDASVSEVHWTNCVSGYEGNKFYSTTPEHIYITPPVASVALSSQIEDVIWFNYDGRPYEDESGAWTDDQDRTTEIWRQIAELERSDNEFIQSPANPSNDIQKVHIRPLSVPDFDGVNLCYSYSHNQSSGTYNLKVRLKEGTTTLAEFTHTNISHEWTYVEQLISSSICASVTDWYNVFIEFEAY